MDGEWSAFSSKLGLVFVKLTEPLSLRPLRIDVDYIAHETGTGAQGGLITWMSGPFPRIKSV